SSLNFWSIIWRLSASEPHIRKLRMSQAPSRTETADVSLTALLLPLGDRNLLLPNVAVVELIPYRNVQTGEGLPAWFLGQVAWRDLKLPLLSFEAASGSAAHVGPDSRVAVIN